MPLINKPGSQVEPKPGRLLVIASLPPRQKWLIFGLLCVALIALLVSIGEINRRLTVSVSAAGGEIREGIVGTPRFINPLLSVSNADRDLTTLIYSGLLRVSATGQLVPDLAANYQMSNDGLTYTFTLKDGLTWQDGQPLTAADIEFTIQKAQDPSLKSTKRAAWEGVAINLTDDKTIVFKLAQPYPAFLENTTLGILPKHLWDKFDFETFGLNQFNSEPIGSGPYQIQSIKRDNLGIPEHYVLKPFDNFALSPPKISRVITRFYPNEGELVGAYERGEIDSFGAISAETAANLEAGGAEITQAPLPRVFGVFFNQNRAPVLAHLEVRQALDRAVDKQAIIDGVLHGYGAIASGPLPFFPPLKVLPDLEEEDPDRAVVDGVPARIIEAKSILNQHGWDWDEEEKVWIKEIKKETTILSLSLATADTPELKQAAEMIKDDWEQLGATVELKIFELGDLDQDIIRPRQYDALFFGEILGRQPDPFAFWHSKQRLDPGLNIAMYTSTKVDNLLDEIRSGRDLDKLNTDYQRFHELILIDMPAVFVYSPYFLYLTPAKVISAPLVPINTTADRLLNIHHWYANSDRVWSVFATDYNRLPD
ncbi:MAG: ABC transporter substrate-binding protein [Patescibacteria group bacterium]|nr:ABC transporter substrate-binding protein [Patescibacteria group bacterium]